ncbi:MAG: phospholipid carrier-dependent glycosyltransferase [Patescibacteria group bacterium]
MVYLIPSGDIGEISVQIVQKIKQLPWHLIIIFLIALFLRTWQLAEVPVGLHGDEASIGYNAYSLLKTGKDQNGQLLSLTVDQFGDYRPSGYHYLAAPFVGIFGLDVFATRLPSALFGAASVIVFYYLILEILQLRSIATLGSIFLAFSPWHIIISRATSESVIAGFFIMLGTVYLIRTLKSKTDTPKLLLSSFVFYTLSLLFYHAARIFVPVFLLVSIPLFFLAYKPNQTVKKWVYVFFVSLIVALAAIFMLSRGADRPASISIFNFPGGSTWELLKQIEEDEHQLPVITRFFHNKLFLYGHRFLSFYFQHFSGEFLFVTTGLPVRYKVPWSGNLYLTDILFIVTGFSIFLSGVIKSKKSLYFIPLLWLFVGALPAGLTWEDTPNIQRASLMLPALLMMSAFGMHELYYAVTAKYIKVIGIGVVMLLFTYNAGSFFHNYFHHLKIHEPWYRSANEEELVQAVTDYTKENKQAVVTTDGNNNFIFYLFFGKFDPYVFQQLGSPREQEGLKFQNITFRRTYCPLGDNNGGPVDGDLDTLYVNRSDCKVPTNARVIRTISRPDGLPVFSLLRVIPLLETLPAK